MYKNTRKSAGLRIEESAFRLQVPRDIEKEPCCRCDNRPSTVYRRTQELAELIRQECGVAAKIEIKMYRLPRERANEILLHMARGMGDDIEDFQNDSHEGHNWTALRPKGRNIEIIAHHSNS